MCGRKILRPPLNAPAMLYPTIRQRIKCAGAKYCAPTRWCIPSWQRLYHSHPPPPASFAIHGSSASHRRSFFSAKRLFFRAARDVSGAHRVQPWARVEIKLKTCFRLYPHSPSHERAKALTSPPPDFLFISITQNPKKGNIPYWYCLLCTPSLTLPPSSLKCLQKSNPNSHTKCFRCFKCFGCFRCFMFAFGLQNRPLLVQIRTKPTNS